MPLMTVSYYSVSQWISEWSLIGRKRFFEILSIIETYDTADCFDQIFFLVLQSSLTTFEYENWRVKSG